MSCIGAYCIHCKYSCFGRAACGCICGCCSNSITQIYCGLTVGLSFFPHDAMLARYTYRPTSIIIIIIIIISLNPGVCFCPAQVVVLLKRTDGSSCSFWHGNFLQKGNSLCNIVSNFKFIHREAEKSNHFFMFVNEYYHRCYLNNFRNLH